LVPPSGTHRPRPMHRSFFRTISRIVLQKCKLHYNPSMAWYKLYASKNTIPAWHGASSMQAGTQSQHGMVQALCKQEHNPSMAWYKLYASRNTIPAWHGTSSMQSGTQSQHGMVQALCKQEHNPSMAWLCKQEHNPSMAWYKLYASRSTILHIES
jgi:hypothetical protein